MQPQKFYLLIFLLISILIVATFWFVYNSTKHPNPDWQVKSAYKLRGKLFYTLTGFLILIMLFTFSMLPYATKNEIPDVVVPIEAQQFSFIISTPNVINDTTGKAKPELPLNKLIEFRVISKDVNHGFGIYSPQGVIISQVQAMPGYMNRLRVKFDMPGTYDILCMEYCGIVHHMMKSEIIVK